MEKNITRNLKSKISDEIMNLDVIDQVSGSGVEAVKDINYYNRELGEDETTEATSSGGAGQYSQPLFTTTKKEMGEKWSKKYKESIDCDNPKGYSQKAFCKSKLEKIEASEATSSSSTGQYSTPAFVAKDSKNWRGSKKPLYPGGKFVKIKDKCKKFPYCNQGDIKSLKLFENEIIKKSIKNISKKYGVNENVIKSIIVYEYENNNN